MSNEAEQHLFILWEKARDKEQEILEDLKSSFKILKEYEIFWDKDKFRQNLSSFYAEDFEYDTYQEEVRGKGAFLVLLVEDKKPIYENAVNQNIFKFKHKWRQILGSFTIHGTDTVKQMRRDLCLLTGKSISDLLKTEKLNGKRVKLFQNLPCVDGWKNLEHIFYVLNETIDYVILRPVDFNVKTHKMAADGDIDFLVDNFFDVRAILCACKDVDKNAFDFFNWVEHLNDKEKQLFHPKFIGDNYYDKNWQILMLRNRIQNNDGIYVLSKEDKFWSLLYHGLIHKENHEKYSSYFSKLSKELNIEYKNDKKYLLKLLNSYLKEHRYLIGRHIDNIASHLIESNIKNKLRKKLPDLYYYSRGNLGSLIVSDKLFYLNPTLSTNLIKYYNRIVRLEGHLLTLNDKLYKEHCKKYLKNELAWFYKLRFGKIVRTTFYLKNGKLMIKKQSLNPVGKCCNAYLSIVHEKPQPIINGIIYSDYLKEFDSDEILFKEKILALIQGVFQQFATSNFSFLSKEAWDMLSTNCIKSGNNLYFIDKEYKSKKLLNKTYILWRILGSCKLIEEKRQQYFCEFRDLFNLEKLSYSECQNIENKYFHKILRIPKRHNLIDYYFYKKYIKNSNRRLCK